VLGIETEQDLCLRWHDHHDTSAAHQLVGSHLRLVVKTARTYRGYGLPQDDLIGEGHMGLMRAVCRFDPCRGVRFSSYAIWWIRAAILEYIMHNWSVVKIGTTGAQKRLFFNLLRMRSNPCDDVAPPATGNVPPMTRQWLTRRYSAARMVFPGRLGGNHITAMLKSSDSGIRTSWLREWRISAVFWGYDRRVFCIGLESSPCRSPGRFHG
jgi:RNA polymerase sigma factor (sigma-70 family)